MIIIITHACLSFCRCKHQKNYWSEIDLTCCEYVLWWTLEVSRFLWHLTLAFDLDSYFYRAACNADVV